MSNFESVYRLVFLAAIAIVVKMAYDKFVKKNSESFYNIVPTELIDPQYHNINDDPFDYKGNLRVGDVYGVDLNCNNVTSKDLIAWINNNHPDVLHKYVYIYDPSIEIHNPIYAPRVLKMLLRNLPTQHPFIPIIRKCFPYTVRIS